MSGAGKSVKIRWFYQLADKKLLGCGEERLGDIINQMEI